MKIKTTSLALLVLIVSMIVGSIPNLVYADSQSDSLIRIATQARDQLRIQLSNLGYVSDEIKAKFEQGTTEIESLTDALKRDDVSAARQHFLSAMKIFKELSQQISEEPTSEAALSTSKLSPRLSNELDRLEKYLDNLRLIANKNEVVIDFTNIDDLIDTARNELAKESDSSYSTIEEIKRSIIELKKTLKEKTMQMTAERAKSFAEKHLEKLDRLITQAQEIGVSQTTIERLVEARNNLNTASNVDQIIIEVKHIISVKEQFENTKAQRIKSRINQLETKVDRLSDRDVPVAELQNARSMLTELKEIVSENKLSEAIRMINSLNNLINEIENYLSSQNNEISSKTEESPKSLDDSKIERIKMKIQRLETELNQVFEQVEDNAAAKRWLENAFSMLENAKIQLDDSPDEVLDIIMKIEQILKRVQNTLE